MKFEGLLRCVKECYEKQNNSYSLFKGKYKKMFEDFKKMLEENTDLLKDK